MRKTYIFIAVLLLLFTYLGLRLQPGLGWPAWAFVAYIFAGVVAYPSNWLRKSTMSRFAHLFRLKVYMDMGFLCFLATLIFLRDVLALPLLWWKPSWAALYFSGASSIIVLGLSFVALLCGVWVARSGPKIKRVKIPIDNLPAGLEGFRIVQISDLHVGPTIGADYVQNVVNQVNALEPDLTVLTGDIVDGHIDHHLPAARLLGQLEPYGQVLFVTGNHEYYWNGPRWIEEIEALGLHVLQNSRRIIRHGMHEILVAGVLDPAARLANPLNKPNVRAAMGTQRDSAVKILLAHQPDVAFEAADMGFDLMLSGHTHAGQFFPFTLLIFKFQTFVKGLRACGKMWVYVNQGTGYWGPPIRLGTVTEITVLELTAKLKAPSPGKPAPCKTIKKAEPPKPLAQRTTA